MWRNQVRFLVLTQTNNMFDAEKKKKCGANGLTYKRQRPEERLKKSEWF